MVEEKGKKNLEDVELTEVTTQTADAFKLPDGKIVGINEYLVWIGNMLLSFKKQMVGV